MAESQNEKAPLFADTLCDHVDDATDFQSLLPIMREIGIDIQAIRNMIKSKIRSLNDATLRKAAFNAMPIDRLLPMDTVQHILSFYHFNNMQHVSKSFKKCFHRNHHIQERSRLKIVEENAHYFIPNVPFDESSNRTFVVCPTGEPLMERVKAIGSDVIVCNALMDCFSDPKWASGDRILLQSGSHILTDWIGMENHSHQIIGIGENVEIQIEDMDRNDSDVAIALCGNSKVLIRNVSIRSIGECGESDCDHTDDAYYSTIGVLQQSILWMDRCNLQGGIICVGLEDDASAHFKSCQFAAVDTAIRIQCGSDVKNSPITNILDCTFAYHESCILTTVPVRSIGNQFTTNVGGLVAMCGRENLKEFKKRLVRKGTVFSKPIFDTNYRNNL